MLLWPGSRNFLGFFLVVVPLRPLLSGIRNFFDRLKIAGSGIWQFFFSTIFLLKAIILRKYLRKPDKDCDFADRQYTNTLIFILGYVVLNKIYLIFQRLQIKINIKVLFSHIIGTPFLVALSLKYNFFCGFPKETQETFFRSRKIPKIL